MYRAYLGFITALFFTIIWYQYSSNKIKLELAKNNAKIVVFRQCIQHDKNITIERIKEIEKDEKYYDNSDYGIGIHNGVF